MATPKIDPSRIISQVELAGVRFDLYEGLVSTVARVMNQPSNVLTAIYRSLSGDPRPAPSLDVATAFVAGELQLRWYEARGLPVSERVTAAQERRREAARAGVDLIPRSKVKPAPKPAAKKPSAAKTGKKKTAQPERTGKSAAIRALLVKGKTD